MNTQFKWVALTAALGSLIACGDSSSSGKVTPDPDPVVPSPTVYEYSIDLVNVTANQPLSPPAVLVHGDNFMAWQVGQTASAGLEELAESGGTGTFIADSASSVWSSVVGDAVVMPGMTFSTTIQTTNMMGRQGSPATRLVQTNDASN